MIDDREIDREIDSAKAMPARAVPRAVGLIAGIVSGGIAVGIGMLFAGIQEVVSPIDAVGSVVVDHVPLGLKEQAIRWFGSDDKLALRIGIFSTLAIIAMLLGWLAVRRPVIGAAGIGVFGIVGMFAALSRPSQPTSALFPSLIGAAVGAPLIYYLTTLLRPSGPSQTPGPSRVPLGWDRRRFLVTSGSAAAVTVVAVATSQGLERRRINTITASRPTSLPTVATTIPAAPTGATVDAAFPFVTPNTSFYRIDTALSFPNIDVKTWKMDVKGMVSKPLTLTYADLLARPQIERTITLTCVSNEVGGEYIGNAVFQGVLLKDVLDEAGIKPGAEQVFGTSVDGFTCGFPVTVLDGRDAMIAIGMNGEALPLAHGFPARIVVPGLYGYVSATKWVRSLELTTWDAAEGYWVPRGWSRDGPIKTQSRIDVPRRGEKVAAGTVRIAGVAWAQHTGIAKVEVRIDKGDWQQATLATNVSDDAWRQWFVDWPATQGSHVVQVRATDKSGYTQTEEVADVAPNGATGYHTRTIPVS